MASKKVLSMSEIIESHKPKNFKYRYIITDDSVYEELEKEQFDLDKLDTINDDELVQAALQSHFVEHDRDIAAHAKRPTVMEDGIIIAKEMVTKADKKLQSVGTGFFEYQNRRYVAVRMRYVRFDILEIFILT